MPIKSEETLFKVMVVALTDCVEIPASELAYIKDPVMRGKLEQALKAHFVATVLQRSRPEQSEFIMQQALDGRYKAHLTLHDRVTHLREGKPYYKTSEQGLAVLEEHPDPKIGRFARTYNALHMVDAQGNLREDSTGKLMLDREFDRIVVHEGAHIMDMQHRGHLMGFSDPKFDTEFLKVRTRDRFHAGFMKDAHEVMARRNITVLDEEAKQELGVLYRARRRHFDVRSAATPNNMITYAAPANAFPSRMEEYFLKLPENNSLISEEMGKLVASETHLAHDPVNAYFRLMRKQYEEFGGIKDDAKYLERLGVDIRERVRQNVTEIGHYTRETRVGEAFAKVIDAFQVTLNPESRPLREARNPIAELHMPHLGEHLEMHVYDEMHKRTLAERGRMLRVVSEDAPHVIDAALKEADDARVAKRLQALERQREQRGRRVATEEFVKQQALDAQKQRDNEAKKKADEAKRKADEAKRKADEEQRQRDEQEQKRKQEEADKKKAADDATQKEQKAKAEEQRLRDEQRIKDERAKAEAEVKKSKPAEQKPAAASEPKPVKKPVAAEPPVEAPPVRPVEAPVPRAAAPMGGGGFSGEAHVLSKAEGAAHGGKAMQWALGVGAVAAGGYALLEMTRRKKVVVKKDEEKLAFKQEAEVAMGSQQQVGRGVAGVGVER